MSGSSTLQREPETHVTVTHIEEELSVFDVLMALTRHRWLIAKIVAGSTLVALAVSFLLPNFYTAVAKIMPPERRKSINAFSDVASLAQSATTSLGLRDPNEIYISMLKSDRIGDSIIQRFNLAQVYGQSRHWKIREKLADRSHFTSGTDTVIRIEVEDRDPKRAAEMANAYVEELDRVSQDLAIAQAQQRRAFYERQLLQAKDNLSKAEDELRSTQENTGFVEPSAQTRTLIEQTARLNALIAAKEVEISSLKLGATEANPDLQRANKELVEMRAQLARMENGTKSQGEMLRVPSGKVPQAGLEYARRLRNVKYYETIYTILAKQFEVAHIDEANNAPVVQALDVATPPEHNSSPRRLLIVLATIFASLLFAVILALLLEARRRHRNDQSKWEELYRLLRV